MSNYTSIGYVGRPLYSNVLGAGSSPNQGTSLSRVFTTVTFLFFCFFIFFICLTVWFFVIRCPSNFPTGCIKLCSGQVYFNIEHGPISQWGDRGHAKAIFPVCMLTILSSKHEVTRVTTFLWHTWPGPAWMLSIGASGRPRLGVVIWMPAPHGENPTLRQEISSNCHLKLKKRREKIFVTFLKNYP